MTGNGHQDLVWFNPTTGVVGSWLLDGAGHVTGTQDLNWTCSASSGCSSAWRPIGIGDMTVKAARKLTPLRRWKIDPPSKI